MVAVIPGRQTVVRGEPFAVFVIGMRFNRLWAVHKWLPVARSMQRMLTELAAKPELGYLGGRMWFGRTIVLIQYWRSVEHLNAYAKARDSAHLPAWKHFNQAVSASRAVGVYHETYSIRPDAYECIYVNMPPFGLGAVDRLRDAAGNLTDAEGRMRANAPAVRNAP